MWGVVIMSCIYKVAWQHVNVLASYMAVLSSNELEDSNVYVCTCADEWLYTAFPCHRYGPNSTENWPRWAHNLEKATATVPLNGYDNSHARSWHKCMLYTSMVGSHWPLSQCQLPMYVWCTAITYLTLYSEPQNRVRTVLLTLPALLCECILCRLSVIVCFASDKPVVVLVYPDCYFSVIPCHAWYWRSSEFVSILVLRLSHNRNDSDIRSGATVIAVRLS